MDELKTAAEAMGAEVKHYDYSAHRRGVRPLPEIKINLTREYLYALFTMVDREEVYHGRCWASSMVEAEERLGLPEGGWIAGPLNSEEELFDRFIF